MSSNTLVAISVGCLFALAALCVICSFAALRAPRRRIRTPVSEKETETTWPKA